MYAFSRGICFYHPTKFGDKLTFQGGNMINGVISPNGVWWRQSEEISFILSTELGLLNISYSINIFWKKAVWDKVMLNIIISVIDMYGKVCAIVSYYFTNWIWIYWLPIAEGYKVWKIWQLRSQFGNWRLGANHHMTQLALIVHRNWNLSVMLCFRSKSFTKSHDAIQNFHKV